MQCRYLWFYDEGCLVLIFIVVTW